MNQHSTREAAKKLGISLISIQRYIAEGKIPAPPLLKVGKGKLRIWTDEDIEHVRQLLPKIANGRKTRYSKLHEKQKAQASKPVPRKKRNSTSSKTTTKPPKANG
jgi:predicted site-specific integrase-resolvase